MTPKTEFSILLAGEAGQGINSIETVLVRLLKQCGLHVFATKEYMSRVRGGTNSTSIRISERRVNAPVDAVDLFIPLTEAAVQRYQHRISDVTIIAGEQSVVKKDGMYDVPFSAIGRELGDKRYVSMVAVGVIAGILGLDIQTLAELIRKRFVGNNGALAEVNLKAAEKGLQAGKEIAKTANLSVAISRSVETADELMLTGTDAVALGAIAGGCDSVFAYPMTPGSGVFTALAQAAHDAGIVVEQVEDEIGVINMALGAWYAGARALVSTSGGGFALMTEGISLSGMTETPVVVHLGQRPGPATGLPTRTEQGDLNLALHAGHGIFPRIIFAPGSLQQAFFLTQRAFNLADEYQIPVFILTDQYFVDMYYNLPEFDLSNLENKSHIVEAGEDYKRYRLTENGVSPRGVPGFGPGRICADSDEHDESGRITEDLNGISLQMKDKRFKKFGLVKQAAISPDLYGPEDYQTLFIAWGSTLHAACEALNRTGSKNAALLHFSQVWPIHPATQQFLKKAKRIVAIENNQTGSFADLLRMETGAEIHQKILKYNGLPFSVEELTARIKAVLT
jgi:2-oxoglutarate ferredoxin oxidoreductase subunit alpha